MTIVRSILRFAVSEELVEYNAAAGVTKRRYERAREPHIFPPVEVEAIRAKLDLRDRTLVSVLAYSGARPRKLSVASRGAMWASTRSASTTPNATAPGTAATHAAGRRP